MTELYGVLSFDIRGSRKIKDRMKLQNVIKSLIESLNNNFSDCLASKFSLTAGDEFQGVLRDFSKIYDVFKAVKRKLDFRFYCGIGIGEITTEISDKPFEMDGPAFYRSRDALNIAKKRNLNVYVITGKQDVDYLLNLILKVIFFIEENRTHRQSQIVKYFEENPKIKVSEVASNFGVSEQSIYKTLKKAGFSLVLEMEELVKLILSKPYEVELPVSTGGG